MSRDLTFTQAVREATDQCMAADAGVYVMGLGVTDPKGIFGTTLGLEEKYGPERVLDMPASENAMTGVAIGSALVGMRPIMAHQRVDFAILALDQIINNAAKWHYMFGGQCGVPIVIRLMIGRGWGQGPQHSQSLQAIFAHIPGLKVVMPVTPHDAKGLMIAAVEDDNPVILLEHRWLHNLHGPVPEEMYRVPLDKAAVRREGGDATIAATSYMTLEALRAADDLSRTGIEAEVVEVRSLKPIDADLLVESVAKTGRLVVADTGWRTLGFSAEILAICAERAHAHLKCGPRRVALPDIPTPTSHALAAAYYPRAADIEDNVREMLGAPPAERERAGDTTLLDVPDPDFTGPF